MALDLVTNNAEGHQLSARLGSLLLVVLQLFGHVFVATLSSAVLCAASQKVELRIVL
jgi:hypothetical protein